mgnify:CR=1 FL=1
MRRPLVALTAVVVLALTCGMAAVAQETPAEPLTISWLATGDSFSSGQGVAGNVGACAQAVELAYAPVARSLVEASGLFRVDPFIFSACSGYLASDFYGIHEGGMGQSLWDWSSAMAGEDRRYDVITLTFGGDDVGFADVLVDCLTIPDGWEDLLTEPNVLLFDDCDVTEEELLARIDGLVGSDMWGFDQGWNEDRTRHAFIFQNRHYAEAFAALNQSQELYQVK